MLFYLKLLAHILHIHAFTHGCCDTRTMCPPVFILCLCYSMWILRGTRDGRYLRATLCHGRQHIVRLETCFPHPSLLPKGLQDCQQSFPASLVCCDEGWEWDKLSRTQACKWGMLCAVCRVPTILFSFESVNLPKWKVIVLNKKQKRHLLEGYPCVIKMTKYNHLGLSLKWFY